MTRAWRENLAGQAFGRLVVLGEVFGHKKAHRRWLCRCECGVTTEVSHPHLKGGKITSCGCFRSEATAAAMTVHGQARRGARTRAYKIWSGMVARCTIPSATGFDKYGGAGIKVCARWMDFENFFADMGSPSAGYSIDRFPDQGGNYDPTNCRWATTLEQNNNRRPRGSVTRAVKA